MTAQTVIFYAFAAILVFAALRVITSRNPVHSALWLVLSFSAQPACGCCCRRSSWPSRWCWSTSAR